MSGLTEGSPVVASPENTIQRPAPESFDDFRAYLRSMISYLKQTNPQFSYRYFSKQAGFSSPNFLKLVAEGKRNLSRRSIPKFSRGLGLDGREAESFETLVLLGQAQTDAERNRHYQELRRRANHEEATTRLEEAQYKVYSMWFALPIREMLLHPDFKEDPVWIGRRLRPPVRASEVEQALRLLEEVGLIVRSEEGRLVPASTRISTGPQVRSLAVRNFHRAMLDLAGRSLERADAGEREITALTVSLSEAQYQEVKRRIDAFRRELFDRIDEINAIERTHPQARQVYQIGFQLFPLTRSVE